MLNPLSKFKPPPGSTGNLYAAAVAIFASFGGFLFGYDTGYIAGVKEMPQWLEIFGTLDPETGEYILTTQNDSLVTSILSAGTFFGALAASPIGDLLGRRVGILVYCLLFSIGVACQTGGFTLAAFVVGRVFAGIGVGGVSCLVPMYQAECAPNCTYQWSITFGLLISAVVVESTKDYAGLASYQVPIGIQFIWGVALGAGIFLLPESPRWLVLKGKKDKAIRSISRLLRQPQDSSAVQAQYHEIHGNLQADHEAQADSSYLACFKMGPGKNVKRVLPGIVLQALQQLSGINFIFYYGTTFFSRIGLAAPFVITIACHATDVVFTAIGALMVDSAGRRWMLMYGALGMGLSQMLVAIIGLALPDSNSAKGPVTIVFIIVFIAHFGLTWGPYAWVVTSEIYPTAIRAKAMSMSTASNWLWNFGIGYATPYMVDDGPGRAGMGSAVFFVWGGCCLIAVVFVFFFIAETKGLSLEQVDYLYRHSGILKSNSMRKKILAEDIVDQDQDTMTPTDVRSISQDKGHDTKGSA